MTKNVFPVSAVGPGELQKLCKEYGVEDTEYYEGVTNHYDIDMSAPHMYRDNNKCILCRPLCRGLRKTPERFGYRTD